MPTLREKIYEQAASEATKILIDQGKLIEAGFALFAEYVIPKDASPGQKTDIQLAFMAGAEHLFSSIMTILDPGEEPTEADMRRLHLISEELNEWRERLINLVTPTQGSA